MTIPDKAVEAAARAQQERERERLRGYHGSRRLPMWEEELEERRQLYRDDARAMMEAAAPYMLPVHEGMSEAEKALREFANERETILLDRELPATKRDILAVLSALSSERERAERLERERDEARDVLGRVLSEKKLAEFLLALALECARVKAAREAAMFDLADAAEARAQAYKSKVKEVVEFIIGFIERQVPITVSYLQNNGINKIFAETAMIEYLAQAESFRAALRWTEEASQGEGE